MKRENLFIAVEGIDGSGKSTQVQLLKTNLEQAGYKVYTTHEPTSFETGKLIRSIFNHTVNADQHTIAALFVADRLQHLLDKENGILAMLEKGYTVITDRYYFSSYAYHSAYVEMEWVMSINAKCAALLKPDLNVFVDVDPETAFNRIITSRTSTELYETNENLHKVYGNYLKAFELLKKSENIAFVNGKNEVQQVASEVFKIVKNLLHT